MSPDPCNTGARQYFHRFPYRTLEEYSEVAAFDVGADDYITKPIKPAH